MDGNRFDTLARGLATRRRILRTGGLGGAAALLALLGVRGAAADDVVVCEMDVRLVVRVGPSAGAFINTGSTAPGVVAGSVRLAVGKTGKVSDATLSLPNGEGFAVLGEA